MVVTISLLTNKVTKALEMLLGFKLGHRQSVAHHAAAPEHYSIPPYDDPLY
jgi:hypothetical protein